MFRHTALPLFIAGALSVLAITAPATGAAARTTASGAAAAAASCSGNLVWHKNITASGTKIGELDIYYNASTGVNCAMTKHGGPTWGVSLPTWVYIAKCQATTPTGTCYEVADDYDGPGPFSYYAGPASVTAGSHCITAVGWIRYQGARHEVSTAATALCG